MASVALYIFVAPHSLRNYRLPAKISQRHPTPSKLQWTIEGTTNIGMNNLAGKNMMPQTRGLGFKPQFSQNSSAHLKLKSDSV